MKTQEAREMAEILVCDDDKDIVEAIEIYLAQEGHHILKHTMVNRRSGFCRIIRWIF